MNKYEYTCLIRNLLHQKKTQQIFSKNSFGQIIRTDLKNSSLSKFAHCSTLNQLADFIVHNIENEVVEEFLYLNSAIMICNFQY